MGRYAVIGLGKFGATVVRSLHERGHEVVAIDQDRSRVQEVRDACTQAIEASCTDQDTLRALGLQDADAVVVSLGERMDASILVTLYLKELGIREIVVKAVSEDHGKILHLIGATEIVHPERDTARRVARGLGLRSIVEYLPLAADSSLVEVHIPAEFAGKTLAELEIRKRYQVLVVAIKRADALIIATGGDERLQPGDVLVLVGRDDDLDQVGRLAG
ncbi:MAG TPA: TrkA family potassium uptake protein [Vicinamibacteria bacterium]|jgi:trk system potassium uptake protein TrkA|nr:TrkA family potassium uptake protein [Vicinamibacteria bacterium]